MVRLCSLEVIVIYLSNLVLLAAFTLPSFAQAGLGMRELECRQQGTDLRADVIRREDEGGIFREVRIRTQNGRRTYIHDSTRSLRSGLKDIVYVVRRTPFNYTMPGGAICFDTDGCNEYGILRNMLCE